MKGPSDPMTETQPTDAEKIARLERIVASLGRAEAERKARHAELARSFDAGYAAVRDQRDMARDERDAAFSRAEHAEAILAKIEALADEFEPSERNKRRPQGRDCLAWQSDVGIRHGVPINLIRKALGHDVTLHGLAQAWYDAALADPALRRAGRGDTPSG